MNYHQRNQIIGHYEDRALNQHLDDMEIHNDMCMCDKCLEAKYRFKLENGLLDEEE